MSVGQWHTHRCFRDLPCRHVSAQKIRAHLGRLGLPYLTLCPYDPIAPHFPVGPSVQGPGQTSRCGIPPDIQTTTHSLALSLGQYRGAAVGGGWVGVLLLGGDRVSVYCVEGHRFNLIMPEGPCATPTQNCTTLLHSSYSSPQLRSKTVEWQTISSTRDKID